MKRVIVVNQQEENLIAKLIADEIVGVQFESLSSNKKRDLLLFSRKIREYILERDQYD